MSSMITKFSSIPESLIDYIFVSTISIIKDNNKPKTSQKLPKLIDFIRKIINDLEIPIITLTISLIYIHRFKLQLPKNYKTENDTPHKIFISSILIASKYIDDKPLTSGKVAMAIDNNLWTIKEINRMERAFLSYIQWNLVINKDDLESYLNELRNQKIDLKSYLYAKQQ
ncbi:14483_t:CDS:2 [Entrophospora sp. SA101]|nr:20142_t:CDS:2 [Entrophospora sp. SA101]CAJ0831103.1 7851_t:CDS:2 [Entrophospora sp. SA101]CAJ0838868.1 14483_t:CDS:2 [Entrophospora sp. SA101]CAJ0842583.1 4350_t:CDS:2 [Entrophospora sp. SA101]